MAEFPNYLQWGEEEKKKNQPEEIIFHRVE
jgi:hypothetical protein